MKRCAFVVCLALLTGCACYPRLRVYHDHYKPTGAVIGAGCGTRGYL